MYRLHIANKNYSSWSLRPWILLRQLNIPFEEVIHPFSDTGNWDSFRQFSPTAKVPCLLDGSIQVWDSLAIVEYLAEAHPGVWPAEKEARAWARCAAAEMHSGFMNLRNDCSMSCGQRIAMHSISPALQQELERLSELWLQGLDRFGGPFLAGAQFSAVDAFFAPIAFRIQSYQLQLAEAAMAYTQRLLALAGMQQWYQAALAETWRELAHEEEIAKAGKIIQDLRA